MILKDYLDGKIADCEREMRKYEEKYGMSFEEFDERVTNDKSFHDEIERKYGVVQAENDYFEWGGAISSLKYLQERLKKLNEYAPAPKPVPT